MIPASKWGKVEKVEKLELTPEEEKMQEAVKGIWASILGVTVDEQTDFFRSGAGSMDVVRSVRVGGREGERGGGGGGGEGGIREGEVGGREGEVKSGVGSMDVVRSVRV